MEKRRLCQGEITRTNVGRIAERIVANELEYHGFRVSDLNKEGIAANADLLAVKDGKPCQIQVKGATNSEKENWWVGYGHCSQRHIDDPDCPVFNQHSSFYKADVVVLVAVRSPRDYRCIVMPAKDAAQAVQINLDRYYRSPKKRDNGPHKPGKMWAALQAGPKEDSAKNPRLQQERELLLRFENRWDFALPTTPI